VVLLLVAVAYIRGRRKHYDMEVEYERQAQRRERLSEMGSLAAGVAHEIRNPLNTISIAAQRLAREFEPTANREQYAAFTGQIRTETGRLNDIITRFLALARDDRRQRAAVELDTLLKEVEALLKIEGDRLGITVTVMSQPGLVVEGDADRLKELFLNLFANTKEALAGRAGEFRVQAERSGGEIEISVSDNGPGIPAEIRDKVFAPYYTSKEAGTGLGLATVETIVSDFGGEIRLDDAFTSGARFVITFPGAPR
jgi:signal transduction histidine kinase